MIGSSIYGVAVIDGSLCSRVYRTSTPDFSKQLISVPIDGSRDEDISIHGLTGYVVRKDASSSEIESDEDDLFELDSSEEEEY